MRKTFIVLLSALTAGCASTPPLSVEELRYEVKRGAAMTKMLRYEVERPFLQTYNAIQANAERCLEVTVASSQDNPKEGMRESVKYRTDSLMTSETTGETFLQVNKKGTEKMPEGGYYVLLADIEAISSNKTKVVLYGEAYGYDDVHQAVVAWARGENDDCPKFPVAGYGQLVSYDNNSPAK